MWKTEIWGVLYQALLYKQVTINLQTTVTFLPVQTPTDLFDPVARACPKNNRNKQKSFKHNFSSWFPTAIQLVIVTSVYLASSPRASSRAFSAEINWEKSKAKSTHRESFLTKKFQMCNSSTVKELASYYQKPQHIESHSIYYSICLRCLRQSW